MRRALEAGVVVLGFCFFFSYGALDQVSRWAERELGARERSLGADAQVRVAAFAQARRDAAKAVALLEAEPSEPVEGGDAGVRLNEWVRWNEPQPPEAAERIKGLDRFAHDDYRLATLAPRVLSHPDWPSLHAWADRPAFDFSWMHELRRYSRWEAELAEPIRRALARGVSEPSQLPVPDFEQFVLWSRLRLLNGIEEQELPEAVADVRALARLTYRSELPGSTETAARILIAENEAVRWARKHEKLRDVVPDPDEESSARALLEVARQGASFLMPLAPVQALSEALDGNAPWPGACALLNGSFSALATNRVLLGRRNPLALARIGAWVENGPASRCRIPYFRALWDSPDYVPQPLRLDTFEPLQLRTAQSRIFAGILRWVAGSGELAAELRVSEAFRRAAAARAFAALDKPGARN